MSLQHPQSAETADHFRVPVQGLGFEDFSRIPCMFEEELENL